MFRIIFTHLLLFLLTFKSILTNAENLNDEIRRINSQISSLNNEENLKYMLNNGGFFNCDDTYCSQISLFQSQIKKNQIQKFPKINILKSNSEIDTSKLIIIKIFSKYNFDSDSTNYKSGLKSISDIKFFKLYPFEEDTINLNSISLSSIGYDNLLVYLPLYLSDSLKNKILSISGQNPDNDIEDLKNYDIFDPESKIYNDICYPITFTVPSEEVDGIDSLKNLDITLEQRKKEIFPGNLYLCPNGCTYLGIDKNTISSVCKCDEKYFSNIQNEESNIEDEEYKNFNFDENKFYNTNKDIYFSLNTLKCLKLPFTSIGFKNNYGSIGIIILSLVVIVCFLILIFIGKEHLIFVLELLSNSIPKSSKIFLDDFIKIKKGKYINKNSFKPINDEQSRGDMIISLYNQKNQNDKNYLTNEKNAIKNEKNNNPPKRNFSLIGDGIMALDGKSSQNKRISEELMKEEKKEEKEEEKKEEKAKTNNQEELLKLKEQYENELRKLKEKNEKDIKKLKKEKDKEIKKLQKDLENYKNFKNKPENDNINQKDLDVNELLVSVPLNSLFTDQEINAMDLNQSISYDKRGFIQIYLSFINMKQPLFFLFNYYSKSKNTNFQIKFNSLIIIIFCYEIMIYIFLYVTFFGSKSISNIFFGTFNLGKKCILGIILSPFCMIIKSLMQYLLFNSMNKRIILVKLKCYSYFVFEKNKVNGDEQEDMIIPKNAQINFKKNVDSKINFTEKDSDRKEKLNDEFIVFVKELLDFFKTKFVIFFIISIFIMLLEWCVISSFCSVYKNSQIEFFISIIICYLFSNIIAFIYCFIPSVFRYYAIKKNSSLLFIFAEITKII